MRKILITDDIRRMANEYVEKLFSDRNGKFVKPIDGLRDFANELRDLGKINYADYVDVIINNYKEILKLEPNEFEDYKHTHFTILTNDDLVKTIKGYPNNKKFYEIIVDKMRYDAVQKKEIRPYMKKLGIKACVYCNASYTVATDDDRATFQIDHSYPKSKYPFLCTSFFNLQPSRMHCNQIKSKNDDYTYSMYTNDYKELNPFYFSIESESIIKYMLNHDSDNLKFRLRSNDDDKIANKHCEFFHLDNLYTQFTDAAEEVVWKGKTFNKAYREQLMNMFKRFFPFGIDDFKRFYLGFYPDPKDVNKRPLTLLMQGIAKDMGLE